MRSTADTGIEIFRSIALVVRVLFAKHSESEPATAQTQMPGAEVRARKYEYSASAHLGVISGSTLKHITGTGLRLNRG